MGKKINTLAKQGHKVETEITIGYENGTKRPDYFSCEWWVDGVKQDSKFFINDNSSNE